MNCEILAALVIIFVIGYAMAWYKYDTAPVHRVQTVYVPQPVKTYGDYKDYGTFENFQPETDHDDQIINRMAK